MKKIASLLFFLPFLAGAQSTKLEWKGKPAVVGLEIAQSIPSYLVSGGYPIRKAVIIEPVIGFNTSERKWTMLTVGYAQGHTYEQNNSLTPEVGFRGIYARMGFETFKNKVKFIRVGYGPVVSIYALSGNYKFEGPAFGDYYGHFNEPINVFLGFQGSVAFETPLGKNIRIRLSGQYSGGFLAGGRVNTVYIPGIGFGITNKVLAIGINSGIHLFYVLK